MIQSEDRIIAFIDILGFKELIKCAEKANDYTKLSNLNIILKKAYELINSDVKSLNEKGLWLMKQLENHLKSKI